jgi:uncharacterized protein
MLQAVPTASFGKFGIILAMGRVHSLYRCGDAGPSHLRAGLRPAVSYPQLVVRLGAVIQTEVSVRRLSEIVLLGAIADVSLSVMGETPEAQVGWQELTRSECFDLLADEHLGRVAVVDDLGPMVVPVNFVLDRHTVLFRTDEGTKLDAAARGGRVAFEVDGTDAATRTGWSVMVRGEAVEVTDPAELARLRELALEPWAPGAKARYVRILPAAVTGRRISAAELSSKRASPPASGRSRARQR